MFPLKFGADFIQYSSSRPSFALVNSSYSSGFISVSSIKFLSMFAKYLLMLTLFLFFIFSLTNDLHSLVSSETFALLPITNGAVVTSGNYEKFVTFNNKRYTHIIDPRTGYPSYNIISVTVFAPSAAIADALATSVFVMGIDTGLNLIDQLPKIECILIDDKGNIHHSKKININNKNN
jgi:hypothetical protein